MKYIILSILFLLLYACVSNDPEQHRPSTSTITKSTDTLSYSYKTIKEISPYFGGTEDNLDTTYYRITYPVFSNDHVNELAHTAIFLEGEGDPHEAAQNFVDGYNEFVEDESTRYVSAAWVKNISSQIHLNTPRLLSLCTRFYEYTGGAHGHTVAIWSNFDPLEMRKIELSDIIQETKFSILTQVAEQYFRSEENLADTATLAKDFFFANGIFALNNNFGLTDSTLIFYYNEYEIKPYAKGPTEIQIPYREIDDILSLRGQQYINSIRK